MSVNEGENKKQKIMERKREEERKKEKTHFKTDRKLYANFSVNSL